MAPPFDTPSLDRVIDRMDARLAELAATADRRARFLLMYRTFSDELRRNLREGRFEDPEWAEALCHRMGEMYFEADDCYQAGAGCPEPWTYAFDTVRRRRSGLVQDMLLGMNAHINYDLPLCTIDTMRRFGDLEELRENGATGSRFRRLLRLRYHDFLLINEVAWESIPRIQNVVADQFSLLLRYANILSFRFSRPIAEQVITEYRDRAWAHTLVMIGSDDNGMETNRGHLSSFALRAAGLVERLTLNPLRHRSGAAVDPDPASVEPMVRALIAQLRHRHTRAIARHALIEYGPEAQPFIVDAIRAKPGPNERAQLYAVLGGHPTDAARETLLGALEHEGEARGDLLRILVRLEGRLGSEALGPALAAARVDLSDARTLLGLAHAVASDEEGGSLLGRSLRRSAHRALDRARDALLAVDRCPELVLPARDACLAPIPTLPELGVAEHALTVAAGGVWNPLEPPSLPEAVDRLVGHPDPWIRACAAWWLGTHRTDPGALEALLEREHDDLVLETALGALSRQVPGTSLEAAAHALLRRGPERPSALAHDLAIRILDGETLMPTTIEKVLHLKNVALFRDVLAEDLVSLARVAEEHPFAVGDVLIGADTPGAAYVIVEGSVEVRGRDGQALETAREGSVLGELSVVSDLPTSEDCVATSDGTALRIAREDFQAMLHDYPSAAIGIMNVLAHRLRQAGG